MSPESVTDVIYYTSCRRRCHLFYRKQTRYIFRNKTKIYGISVSIRICYCLLTGKTRRQRRKAACSVLKLHSSRRMLMGKQIKKCILSTIPHTDIGYTDLQEQVIYNQIHNIKKGYNSPLKEDMKRTCRKKNSGGTVKRTTVWNSFRKRHPKKSDRTFSFCKKGNIGISANYLNFNDLVDCGMLEEKTSEMRDIFSCGRGFS